MNEANPYSVLNIPESANPQTIEEAYLNLISEYDGVKKLSQRQKARLEQVQSAYDTLINDSSKYLLDQEININKSQNTYVYDKKDFGVHSEDTDLEQSNVVRDEFDKEKTVFNPNNQDRNQGSFFSKFLLISAIVGGAFYVYQKIQTPSVNQPVIEQAENQQSENLTTQNQPQVAQPLLSENPQDITDNILYPDPTYLKGQSLLYAPDGSIFPMQASILNITPTYTDGPNTILVQNPKNSAIFGKVIVKYNEVTKPKVLRFFYIPPKETLGLFNIPAGTFQIQIMTLDTPTAYASPIFTIPIGSNQTMQQLANWNYPYPAESLF
jgi:hypothetical protein